nr:MAG TPA: hypothetical protein [Bacteriophage sp.]
MLPMSVPVRQHRAVDFLSIFAIIYLTRQLG